MSGTNYLVDNSVVLSSVLKYTSSLSSSQVVNLPEETVQQFANIVLSIQLSIVVPVTFLVEVTNDTTWITLSTITPLELLQTISLPINYRKLRVTITCGLTAIPSVNFYSFYLTNHPGASIKKLSEQSAIDDYYALGSNTIIGQGKLILSSQTTTSISADKSMRILDGSKIYALDGQQNLTQQVRIQGTQGIDQLTTLVDATVSYSSNTVSLAANAGQALVKSSGGIGCAAGSILILRSSAVFTNGSTGSSLSMISFGNKQIGVGTSDTGLFGMFLDTTGIYPLVTLTVTTAFSAAGNISITIGANIYNLVGMTISPTTADSAAQIVTVFNAIAGNIWRARQLGSIVIFTSTICSNILVATITPNATGLVAVTAIPIAGAASTITFIDSQTFNINRPVWTPGTYVESQITIMNNGRYGKLSIINEESQELVDVNTFTLPYKFGGQSMIPISLNCFGPDTELMVESAILSCITDSIPRDYPIINANWYPMNNVYASSGNIPIPVGFLGRTTDGPVGIIKKMLIANHSSNRIYVKLETNATVSGQFTITNSFTDGLATIVSSINETLIGNITITSGNCLFVDNIEQDEVMLDIVLEVGVPIMVSVCSGTFPPGTLDISFMISYHD